MSCECPTSELPGEAASKFESRSGSRLFARALETTASATRPARKVWRYAWAGSAAPKTVSAVRPASLAFNVGDMRASCRLTQRPLLGRSRPGLLFLRRLRQKSPVPPLLGTASPWLYLAAIPPHLRRGKPRRKCSGQPGGRRSACWRSVYPPSSRCVGSPVSTPCAGGTVPGFAFNGVPLFGQVSRPGSGR